ncbi:SGNH/GDSL hydrolase family protein [Thermodesulfobacteriota bacterium]
MKAAIEDSESQSMVNKADTKVPQDHARTELAQPHKPAITGRAGKLYRNVALMVFNTLIFVVLVNLAVVGMYGAKDWFGRLFSENEAPLKYQEFHPFLLSVYPGFSQEQIDRLISDTRRVPQVYDPFTQFKEPAYESKYVNVSPVGYRVSKNQGPWPTSRDDFKVFIFGGSTTFGYGVADDQTIPSYLQEYLSKHVDADVRVYNFGRCAYFSVQEGILLRKLLLDGHVPNLVVFLDGLNDFIHVNGEPGYTPDLRQFMTQRDVPLGRRIAYELPVTRFVLATFPGLDKNPEPVVKTKRPVARSTGTDLLDQVVHRYARNKHIVESLCLGFNVSPVFVWQPVPLYGYDQTHHIFANFNYDEFSPHVQAGYTHMAGLVKSRDFGRNFIWLGDMQENIKEPAYVDAYHYDAKMCKLIAQIIGKNIVERRLLY